MTATDELLEKLRMLKYDYDSMSTSLEDAIDNIAYELEQAIAATLGSGTCKLELATDMESIRCSACGYKLPKGTDLKATKFCGGCGCEVEQ